MAVTNDQIRPPIKVQNRKNKQSFDTYTFTIDIVSLVLEKTCFAGVILEYKGIVVKYAIKQSAKQRNKRRKPTYKLNLGQAPPRKQPRPSQ